jgi:hypothetical protein
MLQNRLLASGNRQFDFGFGRHTAKNKFSRLLFIEVHKMYDSIDPDEAMRAPTIVVGTMIPGASTFML